ncbi:hypothetical protein OKW30_004574 [Paraburkholderia sp. Clong3]|nr:hypothetical protein [Paraburkholderia sp. CI2]
MMITHANVASADRPIARLRHASPVELQQRARRVALFGEALFL